MLNDITRFGAQPKVDFDEGKPNTHRAVDNKGSRDRQKTGFRTIERVEVEPVLLIEVKHRFASKKCQSKRKGNTVIDVAQYFDRIGQGVIDDFGRPADFSGYGDKAATGRCEIVKSGVPHREFVRTIGAPKPPAEAQHDGATSCQVTQSSIFAVGVRQHEIWELAANGRRGISNFQCVKRIDRIVEKGLKGRPFISRSRESPGQVTEFLHGRRDTPRRINWEGALGYEVNAPQLCVHPNFEEQDTGRVR